MDLRVRDWMVIGALGLSLLAGCVEDSGKAAKSSFYSAPPPTVGDTSGSIAGRILDEEIRPIASAGILIVETKQTAYSDAAGLFTFNDIPPGAYSLVVQHVAFEKADRKVDVREGAVTYTNFTLKAAVIARAWHQIETQTQGVLSGNYVAVVPNDQQTWSQAFTLKDDPKALTAVLFEVKWNPSTALGDGIRFWSSVSIVTGVSGLGPALCNGQGFQPYRCNAAPDKVAQDWKCDYEAEPKSCAGEWMFRPGGSRSTSGQAGAWPQESLTVYTTLFYREDMPADYSSIKS